MFLRMELHLNISKAKLSTFRDFPIEQGIQKME
jgi:hypothetical protein